ncbi:hypothetical protein EV122DRAFT_293226 [Schizophyllum commune]
MSSPPRPATPADRRRAAQGRPLRRRDPATGRAIVAKSNAAKASLRAQQIRLRALKTPKRKPVKPTAKGPTITGPHFAVVATPPSNIDRLSDADYVPTPEQVQQQSSIYHTPIGNIFKHIPRPRANDYASAFLSADGLVRCASTGQSNENGTVQFSHVCDRSMSIGEQRRLEIFMGLERDTMSLDTRWNIIPLCVEIHRPMDLGRVILLPTTPFLDKLLKAVTKKEIKGWKRNRIPRKNAKHFLHHEDVFPPDTVVDVRIVPLSNWSQESGIQHISRDAAGNIKRTYYEPPFVDENDQPVLPLMKVKCSVYFLFRKAYWALSKVNAGEGPRYARADIRKVNRIGDYMRRHIEIDNPFIASS